jgi:hypothetical protein
MSAWRIVVPLGQPRWPVIAGEFDAHLGCPAHGLCCRLKHGDGPGQRHAGSEFAVTAGDQAFVARTAGPASVVAVGSRVTAQCALSVVAGYERDAFGLPDLRGDWYVRRLKIEHRRIDYVPGGPGRALAGHPGKVLRSFEIERMNRWDDDRDSAITAWSVLDLAPLRAS